MDSFSSDCPYLHTIKTEARVESAPKGRSAYSLPLLLIQPEGLHSSSHSDVHMDGNRLLIEGLHFLGFTRCHHLCISFSAGRNPESQLS